MTRINGKGPAPLPRLNLTHLERSDTSVTALFEVIGGPQDGGRLALAIVLTFGIPVAAVQTLLSADLRTVVAEGPIDPRQALAMIPPATTTTEEKS